MTATKRKDENELIAARESLLGEFRRMVGEQNAAPLLGRIERLIEAKIADAMGWDSEDDDD